jgi:pimeloyl-ACP methyl ester carboxylesterase
MRLGASISHVVAIDLPGIGRSRGRTSPGAKSEVAAVVHGLVVAMGLEDVTLVGHDIGGMVAYAYLREFHDLRSAVIMDVPIPGVEPWEDFIRQPFLWPLGLPCMRWRSCQRCWLPAAKLTISATSRSVERTPRFALASVASGTNRRL